MARSRRLSTATVIERLIAEPQSFDFIQAVRVLERLRRRRRAAADALPDARTAVDGIEEVHLDTVRFVSEAMLTYPIGAVTKADMPDPEGPMRLTVALFGLIGPMGVLPQGYTNLATESLHKKNPAFTAFLDIFQHRAAAHFYRASTKYRLAISHERRSPKQADAFTAVLRSLVGLGFPAMHHRLAVSDDTILHYAGMFSGTVRSLSDLEALLVHELTHPVSILPFVGGWLSVAPDEQTHLPSAGVPQGLHCQLDSSAMLGSRAWVAQDCFRVVIGPIDQAGLHDLLPGGTEFCRIVDLVRLYCGMEFDFEINVLIKAAAVPAARLAQGDTDTDAARLGRTGWILSAPSPVDRSDAIFPADDLG